MPIFNNGGKATNVKNTKKSRSLISGGQSDITKKLKSSAVPGNRVSTLNKRTTKKAHVPVKPGKKVINPNKNLDGCAKLLSNMLDKDGGGAQKSRFDVSSRPMQPYRAAPQKTDPQKTAFNQRLVSSTPEPWEISPLSQIQKLEQQYYALQQDKHALPTQVEGMFSIYSDSDGTGQFQKTQDKSQHERSFPRPLSAMLVSHDNQNIQNPIPESLSKFAAPRSILKPEMTAGRQPIGPSNPDSSFNVSSIEYASLPNKTKTENPRIWTQTERSILDHLATSTEIPRDNSRNNSSAHEPTLVYRGRTYGTDSNQNYEENQQLLSHTSPRRERAKEREEYSESLHLYSMPASLNESRKSNSPQRNHSPRRPKSPEHFSPERSQRVNSRKSEGQVDVETEEVIPYPSSSAVAVTKTAKHLIKELKALANINNDLEVNRLTNELDRAITQLTSHSHQIELDLALQPLRSENATLRRKVRLLNQQVKEQQLILESKQQDVEIDNEFQLVHLQLTNSQLKKELDFEKEARQAMNKDMTASIEKLTKERQEMLEVLHQKNVDQHKVTDERSKAELHMQGEVDVCKQQLQQLKLQAEHFQQESHMAASALQQKDAEINRLQNLVCGLQSSMSGLVRDLEGTAWTEPLSLQRMNQLLTTNAVPNRTVRATRSAEDNRPIFGTRQATVPQTRPPIQATPLTSTMNLPQSSGKTVRFQTYATNNMAHSTGRVNSTNPRSHNSQLHEALDLIDMDKENLVESRNVLQRPKSSSPLKAPDETLKNESQLNRYSITDYFRKYPANMNTKGAMIGESYLHGVSGSSMPGPSGAIEPGMNSLNATPWISMSSHGTRGAGQINTFGKGLCDVSMSTINSETSVVSESTISSVISVDDRMFRDGLKQLDDNIARLQHTLKQKSFSKSN
ncbi:unnamed protein product [Owenia fusiformis]|uniref:Uncharacterized protein n=1 Tax=Owenia fusiformis TaxID=6347 RepID=A0A8J1UFR5_OWEFU|nr:unnamed protein product [Owenia fusiformis]